jgi:transposase-like protein
VKPVGLVNPEGSNHPIGAECPLGEVGAALIVTRTPVARISVAMANGRLRCSGCDGRLRPWGYARRRWLRDRGRYQRVRPRRGRCIECRRTHVVLPDRMLLRRLDRVEVIGAALTASAQGVGSRTIGRRLGLPATTVRGWIRRFADRLRAGPDRSPSVVFATLTSLSAGIATPPSAGTSSGDRWRMASRASNGQFLL